MIPGEVSPAAFGHVIFKFRSDLLTLPSLRIIGYGSVCFTFFWIGCRFEQQWPRWAASPAVSESPISGPLSPIPAVSVIQF
eukprot:767941-Hanusia_phi.AAC.5